MFSLLYYTAYSQYMGPTCHTTTHQYTIIDIKSSVAHNAELLNGTLALSLSDCIESCCESDRCDMAVFNNNGTSRGNRNCYFIRCGVDENCLLVGLSHFTTVSVKRGNLVVWISHCVVKTAKDSKQLRVCKKSTRTISMPLPTVPQNSFYDSNISGMTIWIKNSVYK